MRWVLVCIISCSVLGRESVGALFSPLEVDGPAQLAASVGGAVSADHERQPIDSHEPQLPFEEEEEEEVGKKTADGSDEIPWGLVSMQGLGHISPSTQRLKRSCVASSASSLSCLTRLQI